MYAFITFIFDLQRQKSLGATSPRRKKKETNVTYVRPIVVFSSVKASPPILVSENVRQIVCVRARARRQPRYVNETLVRARAATAAVAAMRDARARGGWMSPLRRGARRDALSSAGRKLLRTSRRRRRSRALRASYARALARILRIPTSCVIPLVRMYGTPRFV